MSQYTTYEDILTEAKNPHVTADVLDILVSRTKELSAEKQHELEKLNKLLKDLESKLQDS